MFLCLSVRVLAKACAPTTDIRVAHLLVVFIVSFLLVFCFSSFLIFVPFLVFVFISDFPFLLVFLSFSLSLFLSFSLSLFLASSFAARLFSKSCSLPFPLFDRLRARERSEGCLLAVGLLCSLLFCFLPVCGIWNSCAVHLLCSY